MKNNDARCDCKCIHEPQTKQAIKGLSKIKSFEIVSDFFKTFADNTRLKIMYILDIVGSMCVCDIAVTLNMTKSAISHQLKFLKNSNLIKSNKVGKEVFYSLADEHIKGVIELGLEHIQEKDI